MCLRRLARPLRPLPVGSGLPWAFSSLGSVPSCAVPPTKLRKISGSASESEERRDLDLDDDQPVDPDAAHDRVAAPPPTNPATGPTLGSPPGAGLARRSELDLFTTGDENEGARRLQELPARRRDPADRAAGVAQGSAMAEPSAETKRLLDEQAKA